MFSHHPMLNMMSGFSEAEAYQHHSDSNKLLRWNLCISQSSQGMLETLAPATISLQLQETLECKPQTIPERACIAQQFVRTSFF